MLNNCYFLSNVLLDTGQDGVSSTNYTQNYLELVDSQPLPFPGAEDVNVSGREYTVTNLWEIMDTLENGYCLNAIIQPSI